MSAGAQRRVVPVILSGGAGTRLWPLSRLARPEALVSLTASETMLQLTALRTLDPAAFAPSIVVANAEDADTIAAQLDEIAAAPQLLIVEPCPRSTAMAIAMAALNAEEDALLLVMPSDQEITDGAAFRAAIDTALPLAGEDWLVTFGIVPDRPDTGYGYIKRGDALGEGVFRVAQFTEKPALATAEAWLAGGAHLWNAGIFLFRAGAFLTALAQHAPDIAAAARRAYAGQTAAGNRIFPEPAAFTAAPGRSIDVAVMEQAERIAVVPAEMGWSDLGSWEALHAIGAKDAAGNVLSGDVVAPDSSNCLVRSDGPVVVALGVQDLVIVATERAVLVVPRGETQRVKEAIDALQARRGPPAGKEG